MPSEVLSPSIYMLASENELGCMPCFPVLCKVYIDKIDIISSFKDVEEFAN